MQEKKVAKTMKLALPKWNKQTAAFGAVVGFLSALALHPENKYYLLHTMAGRVFTVLLLAGVTSVRLWLGLLAVAGIAFFFGVAEGASVMAPMEQKIATRKRKLSEAQKEREKLDDKIKTLQLTIDDMNADKKTRDAAAKDQKKAKSDKSANEKEIQNLSNVLYAAEYDPLDARQEELGDALRILNTDYETKQALLKNLPDGDLKNVVRAEMHNAASGMDYYRGENYKIGKLAEVYNQLKAAESFDLIGTESSIKRGKQSNDVPVSSMVRESNMVEPFSSAGKAVNGNANMFKASYGR